MKLVQRQSSFCDTFNLNFEKRFLPIQIILVFSLFIRNPEKLPKNSNVFNAACKECCVLTVLDEWKIALAMVLVEVERVKMVVVCRSAGTVVRLKCFQRDLTIQKCCVDCHPEVLVQRKVD